MSFFQTWKSIIPNFYHENLSFCSHNICEKIFWELLIQIMKPEFSKNKYEKIKLLILS